MRRLHQQCGRVAARLDWIRSRRRWGWPPFSAAVRVATSSSRRQPRRHCATYGDSLINGWGKRGYEWQLGLGVQRELLPRLSAEVTYNRRLYRNLTSNDQIGVGCDRFNAGDTRTCQDAYLNYQGDAFTDFFVRGSAGSAAGGWRRLPRARADNAERATGARRRRHDGDSRSRAATTTGTAVDTNFVWRAPFGLRINGGTSTSRASRETCYAMGRCPGHERAGTRRP